LGRDASRTPCRRTRSYVHLSSSRPFAQDGGHLQDELLGALVLARCQLQPLLEKLGRRLEQSCTFENTKLISAQAQIQKGLFLLAVELAQALTEQRQTLAVGLAARVGQSQNGLGLPLDVNHKRIGGQIAESAMLAVARGDEEAEQSR